MIAIDRDNFKPFTMKLADRISKSGELIPGKEKSFDSAVEMADWYEAQKPVRKHKRKPNEGEEKNKKKTHLNRIKKDK